MPLTLSTPTGMGQQQQQPQGLGGMLSSPTPMAPLNLPPPQAPSGGGDSGGGGGILDSIMSGIGGMFNGGGNLGTVGAPNTSGLQQFFGNIGQKAAPQAMQQARMPQAPFIKQQAQQQAPMPQIGANAAIGGMNQAAGLRPFDLAKSFIGKNEQTDANAISSFIKNGVGEQIDPKQVPWCAGFVNGALAAGGYGGTGSLAARSFLKYGEATDVPREGDIVVTSRGNDPMKGHVGFYAGTDENGNIKILGGNQGNAVSIKTAPANTVLGYRTFNNPDQIQMAMKQERPAMVETILDSIRAGLASPEKKSSVSEQMQLERLEKDRTLRIQQMKEAAAMAYPDNPVMQKVAVAQAALESGLPDRVSGLAEQNNLFGIKGEGTGGSVDMPTTEYINGKKVKVNAGFAKNKTLSDSFTQHGNLMKKPRYSKVGTANTPEEAFDEIYRAGYATDPKYPQKLRSVYQSLYGA